MRLIRIGELEFNVHFKEHVRGLVRDKIIQGEDCYSEYAKLVKMPVDYIQSLAAGYVRPNDEILEKMNARELERRYEIRK